MKKVAILLLSLVIVGGCAVSGAESNDVTLNAVRTGQRVMLTLRNGSAVPVLYNLCSSGLQRQAGGAWEPVRTDEVCTMELRTLEPGSSATFEKTLPSDAGSGQFRYVTNVESEGQRVVVTSNPFAAD
jgi:hypothetical protein